MIKPSISMFLKPFTRRSLFALTLMTLFQPLYRGNSAVGQASISMTSTDFNNVKIRVSLSLSRKIFIEYGLTTGNLNSKTSFFTVQKNSSKEIQISKLLSNTKYFARLMAWDGSKYATAQEFSFITTPKFEKNTFAVQADPHMDENSDANVYNGTLKQITLTAPAFLMDLGDIFMTDKLPQKTETNIRARYKLMKDFYSKIGKIPLFITLGNHDGELGYSQFSTKKYRKEYFPEQYGDKAYFSFTGPNQLHIVLDPFTYTTSNPKSDGWQWTLGREQYEWLKNLLQSSKEQHKFVYIHHLLVGDAQSRGGVEIAKFNEWGGSNIDGSYGFDVNRPGWGKPIHQLLVENKVSFVFKGHDHIYVRQELDGITYQTVPQPSHPGDKFNPAQYGYLSGKAAGGSGFIKVTTIDQMASVEFIKFDGSLGDSYQRSVVTS